MPSIQTIIYCCVTSAPMRSAELLGFWTGTCKSLCCETSLPQTWTGSSPIRRFKRTFKFMTRWVISKCGYKARYWVWSLIAQVCKKANLNIVIWAHIYSGTSDKLISLLLTKADWEKQESKNITLFYTSRTEKREKNVTKQLVCYWQIEVSEIRNEGLLETSAIRLNKLQKK